MSNSPNGSERLLYSCIWQTIQQIISSIQPLFSFILKEIFDELGFCQETREQQHYRQAGARVQLCYQNFTWFQQELLAAIK